ncbi:hypothetical protein O7A70_10020 [Mesorhizobium sp. Cs1299R1N1]|uniref:hypothetical protein n=1 Tax=Mesorhizobium sp. Cs1299R1N1 TaxID=3015172 RepID=UPI00301CE99E
MGWLPRVALGVGLVLAGSAGRTDAADKGWAQLFLCAVTAMSDDATKDGSVALGDKILIAANTYLEATLTEVYPRGWGFTRECNATGDVLICDFPGVPTGRKIVFQRNLPKLTQPWGWKDGYIESDCKPYQL